MTSATPRAAWQSCGSRTGACLQVAPLAGQDGGRGRAQHRPSHLPRGRFISQHAVKGEEAQAQADAARWPLGPPAESKTASRSHPPVLLQGQRTGHRAPVARGGCAPERQLHFVLLPIHQILEARGRAMYISMS